MRNLLVLVMVVSAASYGQGWTAQEQVSAPGPSRQNIQPTLLVDGDGIPWAVWHSLGRNRSLVLSRRIQGVWTSETIVSPHPPEVRAQLRPALTRGTDGQPWLVWSNAMTDNDNDVGFCRWTGTAWSDELLVNQPDSSELNFAPRVASGGGRAWCVWYGGPTDISPYAVYASEWDSTRDEWAAETQVSPPDGFHHWWCDVAVGADGTPHVVWIEVPHYRVLYSRWDGAGWTAPESVNTPDSVRASPWGNPRLGVDSGGGLHVTYTGADFGATSRDVYHVRRTPSGWGSSTKVSRDSLYQEWYADIAVVASDDIWAVWNRQGEGSDEFRLYASHYDGTRWSAEARLDNSGATRDGMPDAALGPDGLPHVSWDADDVQGDAQVYHSHYESSAVGEYPTLSGSGPLSLVVATPVRRRLRVRAVSLTSSCVEVRVFDGLGRPIAHHVAPAGARMTEALLDMPLPTSGLYFIRARSGPLVATEKVIAVGN